MRKSVIVPHRVIFRRYGFDRLQVTIGGGAPSLLGAIFLLPGLALMLVGFNVIHIAGEDFLINGIPVLGLFGLPFFLAGGTMICFRRWLTVDVRQGTLTNASGLLLPMRRQQRRLQEFAALTILLQISSDSDSSAEYYPVILTATAGGKHLTVNQCVTYQEAYAQAATLAEFLVIPIRDQSTNHHVEILPTDLARPLQARLRTDAERPQPTAPATLRSQVDELADGVRISIPGKPERLMLHIVVLLLTIPAVIVFLLMLQANLSPAEVRLMTTGAVLVFVAVPVFAMCMRRWIARHSSTVVTIDSRNISMVEKRGTRTRHTVTIPIAEVIDLDYGIVNDRRKLSASSSLLSGSEGILLKTKRGRYTLAAGLPDDEIEYLMLVMEKALS